MPTLPLVQSYRTVGGYEVSTPTGRDCVIIKRGGAVVFEIVLGGPNMKLVTPGNLEIQAGGSITMTAGSNMTTTAGAAMNTTSGGNSQLNVGGRLSVNAVVVSSLSTPDLTVTASRQAAIDAGNSLTIKAKKVDVRSDTDVHIEGKDITIVGDGEVKVKATKNIVLKGQKILQN